MVKPVAPHVPWATDFIESAARGHCGMTQSNSGDCGRDDQGSIDLSRVWRRDYEGLTFEECRRSISEGKSAGGDGADEEEDAADKLYEEAVNPRRVAQPRCYRAAVSACTKYCLSCHRCSYISVNVELNDCSWYAFCDLDNTRRDVPHFLSKRVAPRPFRCQAPAHRQAAQPVLRSLRPKHEASHPPPGDRAGESTRDRRAAADKKAVAMIDRSSIDWLAAHTVIKTPIKIPGIRCDERYMVQVSCGGRDFLFSRRDREPSLQNGEHMYARWESMLHTAAENGGGARSGHSWTTWLYSQVGGRAPSHRTAASRYGHTEVALRNSLNMSHNAAFMCLGETLVAFGGQAYRDSNYERGIVVRRADPTSLPLRWSRPHLVITGDPGQTSCVEERCVTSQREVLEDGACPFTQRPYFCEYDGKISTVRLGDQVLLFTRSNLFREGGGRHVQLARSPISPSFTFGPFSQLEFDGYTQKPENNIYFISVRVIGDGLLGLYPAVIDKLAGIWCSASSDGVTWTKPVRMWWSEVVFETRSKDWPVDIHTSEATNGDGASVGFEIVVEHDVHISLGGVDYFKTLCVNATKPRLCSYRFKHYGSASYETCTRMADDLAAQEYVDRRSSTEVRSLLETIG